MRPIFFIFIIAPLLKNASAKIGVLSDCNREINDNDSDGVSLLIEMYEKTKADGYT